MYVLQTDNNFYAVKNYCLPKKNRQDVCHP